MTFSKHFLISLRKWVLTEYAQGRIFNTYSAQGAAIKSIVFLVSLKGRSITLRL